MKQLYHFKTQHLVTMLAGVFALVSVQNIAHFFIELHHPTVASWTLGLAIGTALVVLAHLLSEVDMRETKAFAGLLTVTLILVGLSGIIQGVEYSQELGAIGYLLAFVLAATGEIVLPLAHSWHNEAQRRQAVNDAGQRVEEIAAETLIETMSGVDVTRAQKLAEKRIERLIVAHVDSIVGKLMPAVHSADTTLACNTIPNDVTPSSEPPVNAGSTSDVLGTSSVNTESPNFLQSMNDARRNKTNDRRNTLLDLLQSKFNGVDTSTLNRTELADQLGVTRQTVGRDLAALENDGRIVMNGVVEVLT